MVEKTKKPAVKKTVADKIVADTGVKSKKTTAKKAAIALESAVPPLAEVKNSPVEKPLKKPVVKKAAKEKTVGKQKIAQPSVQERYRMVETAAYYIAERSGFRGCTAEYWEVAELEIAAKLAG